MKKIILIICAMVLMSGNIIAQSKSKKVDWEKLTPLEQYKQGVGKDIKSRKIDLKPITPKDGIKTGLVIAYGHVIKPPYKVYIEDSKIMINGVQISPSLIWERETPKSQYKSTPEQKQKYKRIIEVTEQARKIYCDNRTRKSDREMRKKIIKF